MKADVHLKIDQVVWIEFQTECLRQRLRPSHEVERLMREELAKRQAVKPGRTGNDH